MKYFPAMIDLTDKECLIVGGGPVAYRKAKELLKYKCALNVVALKFCQEFDGLKGIARYERAYDEKDLTGKVLVIAATDDLKLNDEISSQCHIRGILVNLAAGEEKSSLIFPAVMEKENLCISISSGGASPAGVTWLKDRISNCIPDNYEKNLAVLGQFRKKIHQTVKNPEDRREIYYCLLEMAAENGKMIDEKDIDNAISARLIK